MSLIMPAPAATAAPSMTSATVVQPSLPLGPASAAAPVLSPEQTTAVLLDLRHAMQEVQDTLKGLLTGQLPIPSLQSTQPPPPLPLLPSSAAAQMFSYPYGTPIDAAPSGSSAPMPSTQEPLPLLRFPPSPSQIPAWALGSSAPIFTTAAPRPHVPLAPTPTIGMAHGGPFAAGTLYGGVDGPPVHGGGLLPAYSAPSPALYADQEGDYQGTGQGFHSPKFHKLEFSMYDGSEDPLNWLNH